MTTAEKLAQLDAHSARVLRCGGPKAVEKQHALGKRTARERIELLMDTGTFTEVDRFVRHRCTSFGMGDKDIPADGVVTGYGKIDGRGFCIRLAHRGDCGHGRGRRGQRGLP